MRILIPYFIIHFKFFCARPGRKELIFIGHWLLIDVSRKFFFLLIDRKMKKKKKSSLFNLVSKELESKLVLTP